MRYETPGKVVDYTLGPGPTGMVGTLAVTIKKIVTGGADTTAIARTTAGIVEDPAGSGLYSATVTLPVVPGDYYPLWDDGTTFTRDEETTRVSRSLAPALGSDAPYFTPSEFKLKYTTNSQVQDLTDDEINEARQTAEEIIEHECHVAFVPRPKTITLSGEGVTRSSIPLYLIREITSVTVDGDTQTVDDTYRIGAGAIYRTTAWTRGVSNIVIVVEHGYDSPPSRIRDAAMLLTFHRAIKGPIDDRATSIPAGEAGGVINLLTPGVGAAITGIPEVDAAIIAHRLPAIGSVSSVPTADSANTYPSELDTFAIG